VVVAAAVGAGAATLAEASSPSKQSGSRMKANSSYQPTTFAQIPGWEVDDHAAAFKAFRKSCDRVLVVARDRPAAEKAPAPAPPPPALVAACEAASRQTGAITKAGAKA